MTTKAGVWIDHRQAIVVLITDAGPETKKFLTGVESPMQPTAARVKKTFSPRDFIPEDRRERKVADLRKKVYDDVLACIRGADSLLILGPGEAKGEFSKHIQSQKIRGLVVELATTDKLSDRQIVAQVSEHFAKAPARKSAATKKAVKSVAPKKVTPKKVTAKKSVPKKAVTKKVAPISSGKMAKKSRK